MLELDTISVGTGVGAGGGGPMSAPDGSLALLDLQLVSGAAYINATAVSLPAVLVCSRADAGYAETAAGLMVAFAANTLRRTDKGLLSEQAATNVALWSRDLTNAAWTKTNCTATLDQVGADGVAASATRLTATAANATCLQSVTLASSLRAQSARVKRLTGSGTIAMTTDGGTTWTTITLTGSYALVTVPRLTLANPSFGFRISTSGDEIAVDFVQNEATLWTSPIVTTTVAATRAADVCTLTGTNFSAWFNASSGTVAIKGRWSGNGVNCNILSLSNGGNLDRIMWNKGSGNGVTLLVNSSGGAATGSIAGPTLGVDAAFTSAVRYAANDCAMSVNGAAVATDTTVDLPVGMNTLYAGAGSAGGGQCYSYIERIAAFSSMNNADLITVQGMM